MDPAMSPELEILGCSLCPEIEFHDRQEYLMGAFNREESVRPSLWRLIPLPTGGQNTQNVRETFLACYRRDHWGMKGPLNLESITRMVAKRFLVKPSLYEQGALVPAFRRLRSIERRGQERS